MHGKTALESKGILVGVGVGADNMQRQKDLGDHLQWVDESSSGLILI